MCDIWDPPIESPPVSLKVSVHYSYTFLKLLFSFVTYKLAIFHCEPNMISYP